MAFSNISLENEMDLFPHWFLDIHKKRTVYKEPVVENDVVKFLKQVCDAFEQTTNVFILAVDVVEDYIRAKKSAEQKVSDPLLAAVTIVFICHKFEGAPEGLKVKHVVDLMYHFTERVYSSAQVIAMEGDVITTLDGRIPINTVLNDLDIILERYMCETRLKANVRPLCLKMLEYLYMDRHTWFNELKDFYSHNRECVVVFEDLISSRFYIPVSILLAAIEITHYRHIFDTDTILGDVTRHTRMHKDHMRVLVAKLIQMFDFQ